MLNKNTSKQNDENQQSNQADKTKLTVDKKIRYPHYRFQNSDHHYESRGGGRLYPIRTRVSRRRFRKMGEAMPAPGPVLDPMDQTHRLEINGDQNIYQLKQWDGEISVNGNPTRHTLLGCDIYSLISEMEVRNVLI